MAHEKIDEPEEHTQPRHERVATLRHDVSNSLYSIWLHVCCAKDCIDDAQLEQVKESLGRIETAIEHTQTAVDELAAIVHADD